MRRLAVLPVLLLAVLLPAAEARAVTYCVPAHAGCAGTPAATIQEAFDLAEASAANDVVRIGPGEFAAALYAPLGPSKGTLEVVGKGAALTTVVGTITQDALEIRRDSSKSDTYVHDLRLVAGDNGSGISTRGRVEDVVVNASELSDRSTGIALYDDDASAARVTIDLAELTESSNHTGVHFGGVDEAPTGGELRDATIVADTGFDADFPATVTNVRIHSRGSGFSVRTALVKVRNALVVARSPQHYPVVVNTSEDNVLLQARHLTLVGAGGNVTTGAFRFVGDQGFGQVDLHSSVVAEALKVAVGHDAAAKLNVWSSVLSTDARDAVELEDKGGMVVRDPLLDADFFPRWPSAAIDGGEPSALEPGMPSTDLAGNPRVLDGDGDGAARRDMGAFEYLGPAARLTAQPATANVGQAVAFDASASTSQAGALSFAWSFGDGASAGSGKTASHAYAAPGVYTAAVTVTDAQGRSATQSATVTVVDPGAQPPAPPAPPAPAPSPSPAPPADTVKPALTGVKWAKARFRARTGSALRWRLSEAATLTLRFDRCTRVRRRRCAKWAPAATRTVAAKAGAGSLKVARKVGRKALRRGMWRVRLRAVDAAGNASPERTAAFSVR